MSRGTVGDVAAVVAVPSSAGLHGAAGMVKSGVDRAVALVALVALAPILLVLGLLVRLTSRGPALYRQARVGRDGHQFQMVKLRTMVVDADHHRAALVEQHGNPTLLKLQDDPRVTRLGRWLRRWSIDELPQLWNVLKGEMSLVGPRPGMPDEVARFGPALDRRTLVRPGITGLWQVSGRSNLAGEESLRLDLEYIDEWSLLLDLRILLRTVTAVLGRHGAY